MPTIAHTRTESGSGLTMLLLNGWCSDRGVFDPLLAALGDINCDAVSLDWRGHGSSSRDVPDFGNDDLVDDALQVMAELDLDRVIPVAVAHAGWVALELRRRLGDRIPGIVLIDWMVLGPPPGFADGLEGLQHEESWQDVRDHLFAMWTDGVDNDDVLRSVRRMADHDFEMWSRGGREISDQFRKYGSPLSALEQLEPVCPTMHLYAQPPDPGFLAAHDDYAAVHPWFSVHRLDARSHFPMLEVPGEVASRIRDFAATITAWTPGY